MVDKVLFSSEKTTWGTPQKLYDELDKEFGFDLDSAADQTNHKHERYLGPGSALGEDALVIDWPGTSIFCNPPYSRTLTGKFVAKAYEESQKGKTVVLLLPSRTDVVWFHKFCIKGEIRFIRGRLTFEGAASSAPFPSIVVIFRGQEVG